MIGNLRYSEKNFLCIWTPSKRKLRIILYTIDKTYSEDELLEEMHSQNFRHINFSEFSEDFRLKFKTGPRESSTVNWVAECSPKIYHELLSKGKVYLDWVSARVAEYKVTTRCYRCQKFEHLSKDCKAPVETCGHCAGSGHDRLKCPLTRLPPKCENCTKGKPDHNVHARNCLAYLNEINKIESQTDLGP